MGNIDWDSMISGGFIRLENGVMKEMTLTNWRPQDKFKQGDEIKPGLTFDVTKEDGKDLDMNNMKEWTVTSVRALVQLKPLIEAAEAANKASINVRVLRVGEKTATQYNITGA